MTLVFSILIWAGAVLALFGALCVLKPLRFLGVRSRTRAAGIVLAGVACAALGFLLPGAEARVSRTRHLIDAFLPIDHFRESHWERMHAPPRQIFAAIHAVTPGEIRGLVPLLWMRSPRLGLTPAEKALLRRPILELMTRQDFVILAEQPGTEIVVGTIGQFWAGRSVTFRGPAGFRAFRDPRFAKVAMNFRVIDEGNGWCKVTTETRVACPDPRARRKFDEYWRVIYPGSSIIRAQWLQAIKRRAERPSGVETPVSTMGSREAPPG